MSERSNREFLSTQEAHEKTGLSVRYLQQLLKNKKVDGFKVGSTWFVYRDSLDIFTSQIRKRGPKGPHKKLASHSKTGRDVDEQRQEAQEPQRT